MRYKTDTGEVGEFDNHDDALEWLSTLLSISGPRSLCCVSDDGDVIFSSLYDGEDFIYSSEDGIVYHGHKIRAGNVYAHLDERYNVQTFGMSMQNCMQRNSA
jgi:hypothetical protein